MVSTKTVKLILVNVMHYHTHSHTVKIKSQTCIHFIVLYAVCCPLLLFANLLLIHGVLSPTPAVTGAPRRYTHTA